MTLDGVRCRRLALRPHALPGALITFCGVDGAGKSSLIAGIERALRVEGVRCLTTFTPTARIREDPLFRKLVDDPCRTSSRASTGYGNASRVNVLGLLLSIMGDLVQHVTDTVVPALECGAVVLCDRYVFTSQAELVARSNLEETEPVLAAIARQILKPDVAFGLDVSLHTARRRVLARDNRADQPPPEEFHARQVRAYEAVTAANGLSVIDTEGELEGAVARALDQVSRGCPRAFAAPRGLQRGKSALSPDEPAAIAKV